MRPEQYERYYKLEDNYWWFIGMRDILLRSLKNIFKNYKDEKNIRILDIGCGTGMVIRDLERFGNVIGLDNETRALEFCKKRGIDKLILGDGNHLPFKENVFDLITAFNIIEHVDNDTGLIKGINRVAKNNSWVAISTAAFNFLWSQHDIVNKHKRRYTKGKLKDIIRKHLAVKKITYLNCILFPFIWLGIILTNLLKVKLHNPSSGFYPVPKFINKILIFILRLESVLLQKFNLPFGVSLLCIAKKVQK